MKNVNLSFNTPIKENALFNGEFVIKGTAITATTTDNNHKFLGEELRTAALTMRDLPLLVDHDNSVDSVAGRVRDGVFDEINEKIDFEAIVIEEKRKEQIRNGLVKSVSIGATVSEVEEDTDGTLIPRGIKIRELSLVAVPADEKANFEISATANDFSMALKEAYKLEQTTFTGNESLSVNTEIKDERRSNNMKEETSKDEMTELKAELEKSKSLIAGFEKKERQNLEEEYKELCEANNVTALDISKMDSKTVNLLMDQIENIVEADTDEEPTEIENPVEEPEEKPKEEPKEEVEEDEPEEIEADVDEGYKIVQSHGSLKGGAFTVVRNKY